MIFSILIILISLCNGEKFYKPKENDETFAFNKNMVCSANITDGFVSVHVFNPFHGEIINKSIITKAQDKRILACFEFNKNFYLMFYNTKSYKIEVYKNGIVQNFPFPSNFVKIFYDTFTKKLYIVMQNRANEINLDFFDKNFESVKYIGYTFHNFNFNVYNESIIDFSIFNNTLYYITKGNHTNSFYTKTLQNENFYFTFWEKINFVILENSKNLKIENTTTFLYPKQKIPKINDNHWIIIQYIFDALLIMTIIYLYKCTKNKLDHFRKEFGFELKEINEFNKLPFLKKEFYDLKSINSLENNKEINSKCISKKLFNDNQNEIYKSSSQLDVV